MPRRSKSTAAAPAARRGRELPVDLMPHVFEYMGDAFDVARCAAVARPWRSVVDSDAFWRRWAASLGFVGEQKELERKELKFDGWAHPRAGVYEGPYKYGEFGTDLSPEQLAYGQTDKCLVVAWSTLRRRLDGIASRWGMGDSEEDSRRRSRRVVQNLPQGGVTAPHARVSVKDQLAWRRRIAELTDGACVLERAQLETIALFGGSERWNEEYSIKFRVFTFEDIEAFLESDGHEPAPSPLFSRPPAARPLRRGATMFGEPNPNWIPVADFQAGRGDENLPFPISRHYDDVIDPHAALLVVLDFSTRNDDDDVTSNFMIEVGYAFSGRLLSAGPGARTLGYDMAPFVSLCHFIDFAGDLRHNPDIFLEHDWLD